MAKSYKSWDNVWGKKEFGGIARAHTRTIEKRLLNKWKPRKGIILEAGCGLGRNLFDMYNKDNKEKVKLIGVDYSSNAIEKAKKLFKKEGINAQFFVMDIRNLQFKDNSIDMVFNQGVIEHFSDPKEPLKEMLRITKKRVIIMVPNTLSWDGIISIILKGLSKIGLYDYKTRFPYDIKIFFTKRSLCRLLKKLGFTIVYSKNIGFIPVLPIPAFGKRPAATVDLSRPAFS